MVLGPVSAVAVRMLGANYGTIILTGIIVEILGLMGLYIFLRKEINQDLELEETPSKKKGKNKRKVPEDLD